MIVIEEEALEFGRLNPAGIEKSREKIGLDWPHSRWTTWNEEATRAGIRHYAYGFGDDNPLYCDPDHAAGARWGGIIALPGFLEGAGLTPRIPTTPEMKARGKGALAGVHMFWAGDHIRFFRPVREGDRLWVRRFYVDITGKESKFGGRSALSVRRRVHWDDGFAHFVGAPRAYDYGMLRNAWVMQTVTDWMGDDAVLVAVDDRLTGFNTLGDLTRLTGSVTEIDESGVWPEVVLAVSCTNQRDEQTATGTLRVRLPSRARGLPAYPGPPADHGLLPGMPVPEDGPWGRAHITEVQL